MLTLLTKKLTTIKMFYFLMFRFNVAGAKNVTLPVDETNKSLQNQLKESIEKGTYIIGDLVVP